MFEDGQVRSSVAGTPQGGVISPLLANIYLHVLDETWSRKYAHLGVLVRYADEFVILCRSRRVRDEAVRVVRRHLRSQMAGAIWERRRKRLYFLHRWPSVRAMKAVRQRIRELTSRKWNWVTDVRVLIRMLNPILRGWGNYFRTGNAAKQFNQIDSYVWRRLQSSLVKRKGRHLKPGEWRVWCEEGKPCAGKPHAWFERGP